MTPPPPPSPFLFALLYQLVGNAPGWDSGRLGFIPVLDLLVSSFDLSLRPPHPNILAFGARDSSYIWARVLPSNQLPNFLCCSRLCPPVPPPTRPLRCADPALSRAGSALCHSCHVQVFFFFSAHKVRTFFFPSSHSCWKHEGSCPPPQLNVPERKS